MGGARHAYKILVGKPCGKQSLQRPRRTWKDLIKSYLREIVCEGGR
jgi:hypothetical protein